MKKLTTISNRLGRPLLKVLFLAISVSSTPLMAAKINIHITKGGLLFSDYGVPSRLPKYVGNTPAPIVPGTEDILDCHAIVQENPDYLKTTEAGALCNAVAQLQRYIKDPVQLDIEFVIGDLQSIWPGTLGATIFTSSTGYPNQANQNKYHIAYDTIVAQLKRKNAQDLTNNPLVTQLPSYNQLDAILPNDPYYLDNPNYPQNKWRPSGISLTSAQLKALGVRPNFYSVPCACAANVPIYLKHLDMDFGLVITDDSVGSSFFSLDYNISDGVGMQGPYSKEVYNSIDFTNPATWPAGFVLTPRYVDLQGVVMHELSHGLGFVSKVGPISDYSGDIALPPPSTDEFKSRQSVTPLDLFRFKNSDAESMKSPSDFRTAPRFWSLDNIVDPSCNYDKGTAVAVLDFEKGKPVIAPLANGYYLDRTTLNRYQVPEMVETLHISEIRMIGCPKIRRIVTRLQRDLHFLKIHRAE